MTDANPNQMPDLKLEDIVELMQNMVRRSYESELTLIYIQGGDFGAYQKAIKLIMNKPADDQKAIVVRVCLEGMELLRYPFFDVEFTRTKGMQKLGVTGQPENVVAIMRMIGGLA